MPCFDFGGQGRLDRCGSGGLDSGGSGGHGVAVAGGKSSSTAAGHGAMFDSCESLYRRSAKGWPARQPSLLAAGAPGQVLRLCALAATARRQCLTCARRRARCLA
jgi:hypothetical protein